MRSIEPGIHFAAHSAAKWIPGSRQGAPRNDGGASILRQSNPTGKFSLAPSGKSLI